MKNLILEPFPNLREVSIDENHLEKATHRATFIVRDEALDSLLARKYGRDNLCLKVFPSKVNLKHPKWRGTHIIECTKIQNLFAREGRAPRIYDLIVVNKERFAQVMDYVEPRAEAYERIMQKHDIGLPEHGYHHKAVTGSYMDGCMMDFGHFHFRDPMSYQKSLGEKCYAKERKKPHHAIPELGVEGIRVEDMAYRVEALRFDGVKFKGRSVLDIGCSAGAFCREAVDRGARRVVGVDKEVADGAYELSNWLGYWNIDYLDLHLPDQYYDIKRETGLSKFDIVLLLDVVWHTGGFREELLELVGDVVIFNGMRVAREEHEPELKGHFSTVEFLGYSLDSGKGRPVFRCKRK